MNRRGPLVLVWVLVPSAWALACGGPPPDTPSAVILFSPETICQGDAHRTTVALDGTMSSRHLALIPLPPEDTAYPDGATVAPLAYQWTLEGDEHTIVSGSLTAPTLSITALGDRPLHVTLTTTNLVGGSATSLRTLPITVPTTWPRHCSSDAACPGGACALIDAATGDAGGSGVCVGTAHCTTDATCDPCFVCDPMQMACVPRPAS